jgi:hypothetical protein
VSTKRPWTSDVIVIGTHSSNLTETRIKIGFIE